MTETVFVGIPTYDEWLHIGSAYGLLHASKRFNLVMHCQGSSALPFAFNQLWARAVMSDAKYFAMLHADVGPEPYWIDTLVDELEENAADIMSAIIPIKDASNCYSVALAHIGKPAHYRLTVEDALNLPETFGSDDLRKVSGKEGWLCANTGAWVCRLDRPWVKQIEFKFVTGIDWTGEKPRCTFIPEDWGLSQDLTEMGYKVMSTKKVRCTHAGNHVWASRPKGSDG